MSALDGEAFNSALETLASVPISVEDKNSLFMVLMTKSKDPRVSELMKLLVVTRPVYLPQLCAAFIKSLSDILVSQPGPASTQTTSNDDRRVFLGFSVCSYVSEMKDGQVKYEYGPVREVVCKPDTTSLYKAVCAKFGLELPFRLYFWKHPTDPNSRRSRLEEGDEDTLESYMLSQQHHYYPPSALHYWIIPPPVGTSDAFSAEPPTLDATPPKHPFISAPVAKRLFRPSSKPPLEPKSPETIAPKTTKAATAAITIESGGSAFKPGSTIKPRNFLSAGVWHGSSLKYSRVIRIDFALLPFGINETATRLIDEYAGPTITTHPKMYRAAAKVNEEVVDLWSSTVASGVQDYLQHEDLDSRIDPITFALSGETILAPTERSGWRGISFNSTIEGLAAQPHTKYAFYEFDTEKLLVKDEETGVEFQLLRDPMQDSHFGLAPIKNCSRAQFDRALTNLIQHAQPREVEAPVAPAKGRSQHLTPVASASPTTAAATPF